MAYRDFPTTTMVELTAPWIDLAKQEPLLRSFRQTNGLMEDVIEAHQTLIRLQPIESRLREVVQALIALLFQLDRRHDRKLRGIFNVLTGLSDLADTPEDSDMLLTVRNALFPNGLANINLPYRDEAGNARLLDERMTDEQRAILAAVPTWSTNLLVQLTDMIDTAKTLGEKAEELRQTKDNLTKDDDVVTRADLLEARRQWVRVVQRIEDNLDLTGATDAQRDLILGPLHNADATIRAKKLAEASNPAPASEDTSPPLPSEPTDEDLA